MVLSFKNNFYFKIYYNNFFNINLLKQFKNTKNIFKKYNFFKTLVETLLVTLD